MSDHPEQRFEEMVREVVEPVRRYLLRRIDPDTADEVLAETLVVLWRRLDDVPAEAIPWAIGVARLQLRNALRAQRRSAALVERVVAIDPPAASVDAMDDDAVRLRELVQSLPPREAEVLRLWAWEQLEPREIAQVLGVTANAVSIRLHRARRRLADLVRKDGMPTGHISGEGAGEADEQR